MKTEAVRKLSPYKRLLYFINERESIRRKRELRINPPWTDDEILGSYRFCNVRRMDDKVSKWLYNNWYKPYKDHPNTLLAVVLARHFNLSSTLEAIGFPEEWLPEVAKRILKDMKARKVILFNNAYIIRADAKYPNKYESVIDETVQQFVDDPPKLDTSSMQACTETVMAYRNLAGFMAGQVVADLRWAVSGGWRDRYTYAPMGPGSKRGMNRLQGRKEDHPLSQEDFLKELQETVSLLEGDLSVDITKRLELMDYQNCMCEYDKYTRVLTGEGKPKQRYVPR